MYGVWIPLRRQSGYEKYSTWGSFNEAAAEATKLRKSGIKAVVQVG